MTRRIHRASVIQAMMIGLVWVGVARTETVDNKVSDLTLVVREKNPLLEDKPRRDVRLTLQDCISRALANNYNLQVGSYDPAVRMADVTQAEAAFDATLYGSVQINRSDRNNISSGYYTRTTDESGNLKHERFATGPFTKTSDDNYALGLRKLLPAGGVLQLSQNLRVYEDHLDDALFLNPYYESGLQLQLRQPLLRDFGVDVNRAGILAARNRYKISQQQFQLLVTSLLSAVEESYWSLYSARQQVKFQKLLLDRSDKTLTMVLARENYDGRSISLARTQAVIAKAQADLLTARRAVLQLQDRLVAQMNDPNLTIDDPLEIVVMDDPLSDRYVVDRTIAGETALKIRPEILAQRLTLDTSNLALEVSRNQALPRLDLIYQQEVTGADGSTTTSYEEQWNGNLISYAVGVSFETPFGNRAAQAAYEKARKQYQQENRRLDSVKQDVQTELSLALHNLELAFVEIKARLDAVEYDRNEVLNFLALQDTERQDTVTPEFLNIKLNADQRLAFSQISAVQSMVQYGMAIMNVHKAQGTLLRYNNVTMTEADYQTRSKR